jgi:hypothetical protein
LFLIKDLKEQIRCIQKFKSVFVKDFSSASPSYGTLLDLQILLKLYLHPDHSLLRKSVEWIIETVCTNKSIEPLKLKQALQSATFNLVQSAEESGILCDGDIEIAAAWALSFTCTAMLDKEYPFLDTYCTPFSESAINSAESDDKLLRLDDTSPLIQFLSVPDKLFVKFSKVISAQETDSSAEVIRYVDCCGECMRAIMTTIKSRRCMYVTQHGSDKWIALIDSVLKNGCALLQSQLVHKDTVTATAMSVICLQWLLRYTLGETTGIVRTAPITQLTIILRLLNLTPQIAEQDVKLNSDNDPLNTGVHSELLSNLSSFPIISRCAILRACLTAFDEEVLSAVAYRDYRHWATTTWSSPQSSPILLGPLFDAVFAVCSHSLPLVQLYGLQTLECWFNCLDVAINPAKDSIVTNMFVSAKSRLKILTPLLRRISGLLMSTWSHPSKQVIRRFSTVILLDETVLVLPPDENSLCLHAPLTSLLNSILSVFR